jgi:hypothetical protein
MAGVNTDTDKVDARQRLRHREHQRQAKPKPEKRGQGIVKGEIGGELAPLAPRRCFIKLLVEASYSDRDRARGI